MHHRDLLAAVVIGVLRTALGTADTLPVKVYPAAAAREPSREQGEPIVIDGRIDEPEWTHAPMAGDFTFFDGSGPAPVATRFRVVANSRFLYLAVGCDEPEMARLKPEPCARDSHEVFGGEAVEVFVDPKHDHAAFYQIAFSAAGSLWDSQGKSVTWDSGALVATARGTQDWTAELALPWEALGLRPGPGTTIGFNVCRDRQLGSAKQWTNWSQTAGGFHDAPHYGHLVLGVPGDQVGRSESELRKGGRTGPLEVCGQEQAAGSSYEALARSEYARARAALEEIGQLVGRPGVPADLEVQSRELARRLPGNAPSRPPQAEAWAKAAAEAQALAKDVRGLLYKARLGIILQRL
jgi:hypothetical protein